MTLLELSSDYRAAAEPIRRRLRELRTAERAESDPKRRFSLTRRRLALQKLLLEMNELTELTARYYERGYYRNEKYRL